MFQCLGLGTHETGGCGEDWWHPGCAVGLGPKWYEKMENEKREAKTKAEDGANGTLPTIAEDSEATPINGEARTQTGAGTEAEAENDDDEDDGPPLPPGFPAEDDFEGFICYKCVEAHPWIKRYAGTEGFLPPVYFKPETASPSLPTTQEPTIKPKGSPSFRPIPAPLDLTSSKKRKVDSEDDDASQTSKRPKNADSPIPSTETYLIPPCDQIPSPSPPLLSPSDTRPLLPTADPTAEEPPSTADPNSPHFPHSSSSFAPKSGESTRENTPSRMEEAIAMSQCRAPPFPHLSSQPFSLFFLPEFREKICRCPLCFPLLVPHPQLLEEEETYQPPVSEDGNSQNGGNGGGSTQGSGSLYERGESALRNVDRVKAIEGVMAYNHLKDKLKPFFKEFAESGKAISAEDIKGYFAKLRGDEEVVRRGEEEGDDRDDGHGRREQSGY